MAVFITIVTGVLVYVLGQLILKLLIEPVHELKREISKIVYDLVFYSNKFANPLPFNNPDMVEACKVMRQHSSLLHSATHLVPKYKWSHKLFGLPSPDKIQSATRGLIRLSNGFHGVMKNQEILNMYAMQKVKIGLNIPIPPGEYLDPEDEKHFINAG